MQGFPRLLHIYNVIQLVKTTLHRVQYSDTDPLPHHVLSLLYPSVYNYSLYKLFIDKKKTKKTPITLLSCCDHLGVFCTNF